MEGGISIVTMSACKFSTPKKQGTTTDSEQLADKGQSLGHCYQSIMEILPFVRMEHPDVFCAMMLIGTIIVLEDRRPGI